MTVLSVVDAAFGIDFEFGCRKKVRKTLHEIFLQPEAKILLFSASGFRYNPRSGSWVDVDS